MRVIEVNNTDLVGRAFNGFDLHLALIDRNIAAKQVVLEKQSNIPSVIQLPYDEIIRQEISYIEQKMAVSNLLFPFAEQLMDLEEYKEADIVHFHFPYHQMFSLLDYPKIMKENSIWTIHDPWILTGNCTHPMQCEQWKVECKECGNLEDDYFPMCVDNVNFMWKIKEHVLKKINPHIVVASHWMKKRIEQSPLTCHFSKIHVIPFGIQADNHADIVKKSNDGKITVGFRAENGDIKGCSFLYEALRRLKDKKHYKLEVVGNGDIPQDISQMYEVAEYGFVKDRQTLIEILKRCDVFVMPSLAESFGLMALEAMACKCVVICFKETVIEENINVPKCGVAVAYKSGVELADAIEDVCASPDGLVKRQENGYRYVKEQYSFERYVRNHVRLFEEVLKR